MLRGCSLESYLDIKNLFSVEIAEPSGVHVWLVLMKAHRALSGRARSSIAETGMCLSDFAILELLLHKGPMPVNALATRTDLTSGSGTTAVDRLEKRLLVERHPHATDRRTRVVHLTSAGRSLIETAFERHARDMESAARSLSGPERAQLLNLLRKLGKGESHNDSDDSKDTHHA
jgi:MarR family 2-MHQ and catechol resistance regulon transcriptional repressor